MSPTSIAFNSGPRGSENLEVIGADGAARHEIAGEGAVLPVWQPQQD